MLEFNDPVVVHYTANRVWGIHNMIKGGFPAVHLEPDGYISASKHHTIILSYQ